MLRELCLDGVVAVDCRAEGVMVRVRLKCAFLDVEYGCRVDVDFAVADFEMQVRSAGTARVSAQSDELPAFDGGADFYESLLEVPIEGASAVGVFYHDVVAVAAPVVFRDDDLAGVGGNDGVPDMEMHVDASVQAVLAKSIGGVQKGPVDCREVGSAEIKVFFFALGRVDLGRILRDGFAYGGIGYDNFGFIFGNGFDDCFLDGGLFGGGCHGYDFVACRKRWQHRDNQGGNARNFHGPPS